ncbi:MAG: M20/M25/M40 family metallo-hydrolase [Terrimicrobiaceae bacterium]
MLNFSDCLDLLREMINIESVNASVSHRLFPERELALFLESRARALGFKVRRLIVDGDTYNLLIIAEKSKKDPWIVFDSHLDTVGLDRMTIPPLAGEIQDGRMYGRGACDTKASGATMLTALSRTVKSPRLANNVAVLFTTDEEAGKSGASGFRDRAKTDLGWEPDLVVVGEPTRMQSVVAHNGILRFSIETLGVSVHSSRPELGRSAISDMLQVVAAIEGEYAPSLKMAHPLTGTPRCSVNVIHGGSQFNVVPGSCRIEVDRRLTPDEDVNTVHREFESYLASLGRRISGLDIQIVEVKSEEPMVPLRTDEILQWLGPTLEQHQIPAKPLGAPYGTNAGKYTEVGWPAVVLGPGDISQAHTADEWIDLHEINLAIEVYSTLMQTPFSPREI